VLGYYERTAERDHHQYPEQPAEDRDQHHPRDLKIESKDHDCGHRNSDAKRD
jgi:hypothetical protein